jgi:hypothetical protein
VRQDHRGRLAHKVRLVVLDQQDRRELQVLPVQLVQRGRQVVRAPLVLQELQDRLDQLDRQDLRELQAQLVQRERVPEGILPCYPDRILDRLAIGNSGRHRLETPT